MSFTRTVLNTPINLVELRQFIIHLRQCISIDAFQQQAWFYIPLLKQLKRNKPLFYSLSMQHSKTLQSNIHIFCDQAVMVDRLRCLPQKQMRSTRAGANYTYNVFDIYQSWFV